VSEDNIVRFYGRWIISKNITLTIENPESNKELNQDYNSKNNQK